MCKKLLPKEFVAFLPGCTQKYEPPFPSPDNFIWGLTLLYFIVSFLCAFTTFCSVRNSRLLHLSRNACECFKIVAKEMLLLSECYLAEATYWNWMMHVNKDITVKFMFIFQCDKINSSRFTTI